MVDQKIEARLNLNLSPYKKITHEAMKRAIIQYNKEHPESLLELKDGEISVTLDVDVQDPTQTEIMEELIRGSQGVMSISCRVGDPK